jgi:hypothetical protein
LLFVAKRNVQFSVSGIPDTKATFTAPDEKAIRSDTVVPDGKSVRRAMKQQVEKLLESGGAATSNSIILKDTVEALMLAQIVNNTGRPSVHLGTWGWFSFKCVCVFVVSQTNILDFATGTKHFAKAEILETFLQGVRDNTKLQAIVCSDTGLSRAEMVSISQAVNWKHPCIIRKLDLRKNYLGHGGVNELARALKANITLTTLDLSDNYLGTEGCKVLAEAIRLHPTLDRLSMGNNNIRAEGAHYLRDALVDNTMLRRLEIAGNKLGQKGATFIARLIVANKGLNR